jgi:hypothetical protein
MAFTGSATGFTGTGEDALQLSTLVVDGTVADGSGFYDLDGDGAGDSDFLYTVRRPNSAVIVVDAPTPTAARPRVITDVDRYQHGAWTSSGSIANTRQRRGAGRRRSRRWPQRATSWRSRRTCTG